MPDNRLLSRGGRRPWIAAVAAAAVALALAGCAGQAPAAEETSSAPTVDIDADFFFQEGDIPADPERVVVLWRTGSSLAELGVVPVGALEGELSENELTPEQFALVSDVPVVGTYEGVDIEKIIELDPDLIIGMDNGGLSIDYEELAELFPVAILSIAEPTDVWRNYETVAQLVGKSADFTTQHEALTERLDALNAEYGDELGATQSTILGGLEGQIWVDTSKSLAYDRLTAAGFGYNPAYTDNPERYVEELTRENIPTLADQDIIFFDAELDGSTSADVQAILDEPAFQELPAVVAGHLYPIRGATVYTFTAANLQVDDLAAAAKAFTGR